MKDRGRAEEVNVEQYPNAVALLDTCHRFLNEIDNLTPGHKLEDHLNQTYPPSHPIYQDIKTHSIQGMNEGWFASTNLDGPQFRSSKLSFPSEATRFFSITAVYMESQDHKVYSGIYHGHPYGEVNCIIPLNDNAQLKGMNGWQGAGWTCPGPGTHHYPQVRNGALLVVFFLPAGRIAFDANPKNAQPECV